MPTSIIKMPTESQISNSKAARMQRIADQIMNTATQTWTQIFQTVQAMHNTVWNNEAASPAEMAVALGDRGASAAATQAAAIEFLAKTLPPDAPPQYAAAMAKMAVPDGYTLKVNSDGTITITEPA